MNHGKTTKHCSVEVILSFAKLSVRFSPNPNLLTKLQYVKSFAKTDVYLEMKVRWNTLDGMTVKSVPFYLNFP